MATYNRTLNALRSAPTLETAWEYYHGAHALAEDTIERDFASCTLGRVLLRLWTAGVRIDPKRMCPFFEPAYA